MVSGKKHRPKYSITPSGIELLTFNLEKDDLVKREEGGVSFQVGTITEITIDEDGGPGTYSLIDRNQYLEERLNILKEQVNLLKKAIREKFQDNEKIMRRILMHIDTYLSI